MAAGAAVPSVGVLGSAALTPVVRWWSAPTGKQLRQYATAQRRLKKQGLPPLPAMPLREHAVPAWIILAALAAGGAAAAWALGLLQVGAGKGPTERQQQLDLARLLAGPLGFLVPGG